MPMQKRIKVMHNKPSDPSLAIHLKTKKVTKRSRALANFGALAAAAAGIGVANLIGVGELTIGALVGYATYRVIRYGISPQEAVLEGFEIERGEGPKRRSKRAA